MDSIKQERINQFRKTDVGIALYKYVEAERNASNSEYIGFSTASVANAYQARNEAFESLIDIIMEMMDETA